MRVKDWLNTIIRPTKTLQDHFEVIHQFHGMDHHYLSETYHIHPKSPEAIQLFYEGVQFPYIDLHLKCKIEKSWDEMRIQFHVQDPSISQSLMEDIKGDLLHQLVRFQKKMSADPKMNYIQNFCADCVHHQTLPFNVCAQNCHYAKSDGH